MSSLSDFQKDFKTIDDIIFLPEVEIKSLFSKLSFRKFCKKKFLSNSFVQGDSYDIDIMAKIVFYYCSNLNFGLYHNLKNIELVKKLQNSKFDFDIDFLLNLIPEKLFISMKTVDTLLKEIPHLHQAIFSHYISFYIEFIIDENRENWLNQLLQVWDKNFSIEYKFPVNTLIKALKFGSIVYLIKSKTKNIKEEALREIIAKFEKERRQNLIRIISKKTKMDFEIKLIFGFLFGTVYKNGKNIIQV